MLLKLFETYIVIYTYNTKYQSETTKDRSGSKKE